jgi:hypothetical protein
LPLNGVTSFGHLCGSDVLTGRNCAQGVV